MRISRFLLPLIAATLSLAAAPSARADGWMGNWQVFPKSSHQLYETYALFVDDQFSLMAYGAARYWGSVGGTFALAGNPESPLHPQVFGIASVQANMIFDNSGRIYSDEIDVHAGGGVDLTINPVMRVSLGFIHFSGHVADGAVDPSLLGINYNLGDNMFFARFVYDFAQYARFGVTFEPVMHGGPDAQFFGANQFAEFFPLGAQDEQQKPSPYIAASLTEGGTSQFGEQLTFNAQIGCYFGNHFSADHRATIRPVFGFYTGADPRLKYFQFEDSTENFWYLGGVIDL